MEKLWESPQVSGRNSKDIQPYLETSTLEGSGEKTGAGTQPSEKAQQETAGRGRRWRCREGHLVTKSSSEREPGSTLGKRQREHRLIMPESPSQASFLCTNPVTFPGSLQGVPTLLFLKLTRTGLVGLSALYVQTWGLLRLAPTSLGQSPSSCWCSAIPGFLSARGGGQRNGPAGLVLT